MAINLLDKFKDVVGDQLARQASGFLGESTSSTSSALSAILPAILGGLINKAESQGGSASILDFLKNENVDGSILENLSGMFGGGDATNEVLQKGSGALDFIFGPESSALGKILDFVTSTYSIGRGSASSLVKMTAPLVMGIVGRTVKTEGLDVTGLSALIASQKENVQRTAPSGLLNKMDLGAFTARRSSDDEEEEIPTSKGSASKSQIGPWIVLIGIALTMLYLMKSCGGREDAESIMVSIEEASGSTDLEIQEEESVVELPADEKRTLEMVENTESAGQQTVLDSTTSIKLPEGSEIQAIAGSLVHKVYNYLEGGSGDENTRFTFDHSTFQNGTTNLAEGSLEQLKTVAAILNAYPKAAIRIEGHTDNTGNAAIDQVLSEQRALAVKEKLNSFGVENVRMVTAGFGQDNPIASNETKAGQKANQRVDLYIAKN